MALLTPPNSPNTLLVQVPLPQPVASPPQQANQPAQPQPQAKPAPTPKPDPFKKVKGPPAMIIPHTYQSEPKREQMQKNRKPIRFSREDVEAILPNVQADPHDHASRGALADALEESGLHHDDESLEHLRAFDRPVYGMKHPESGKYVFSPRRRWLLGELLGGVKDKFWISKSNDEESGQDEHSDLSRKLKEIGLPKHASFLSDSGRKKKSFMFDSSLASIYSPEHEVLKDDVNPRWGKHVKTATPQGFGLKMIHPRDYYSGYIHDDLEFDYQKRKKDIADEHKEMNKEDKLYKAKKRKKKEKMNQTGKPTRLSKIAKLRVQFSRSAVKSLLHQIGDDHKAKNDHHRVMTDALEESGSGTLGRLIRSYIDGNKTNQHVEWLHTDGNPLHGLVDQRTMFPAIGVDHFGKHGDFHVFHESDHDGENGKHLLHFIHDDSYHTGHPQIRYQFEFHPHELYQFAHDLKNDESFNVDGEAGKNLVDRLDYWIEKSGEAQAKQPTSQESVPFNRPVKFNKEHWGTPEFKNWFGDWQSSPEQASKVTNPDGTPKVVYHGTQRPDRIGDEFKKNRATSGPMSFFTDDPEVASGYATSKRDTSLEDEGYDKWFKMKDGKSLVDLPNMWHRLGVEQKLKIHQLAPRVGTNDDGEIILHPEGHNSGTGGYDYHIKEARGNHFKALIEEWLNSGNLVNSERDFLKVLKLSGLDHPVEMHDPHATYSGVVPVYLSIKNPLNTHNIPDNVIKELERSARRVRKSPQSSGADFWDKNTRDPIEWIEALKADTKAGENSHAWTSIPDWVTKTLKKLGYDGINDRGNKLGGGEDHHVFIPFEPTQVKSAIANRGTYNPKSKKLHLSRPVKFKLFERLGNVADFVASSPVKASNLATNVWNKTGELYTDGELFSTIGRGVDKAAKGIWHGGLKWGQALAKGLTGLGKKLPLGLQGPAIKQLPKPDSKPKQPVSKPKKRKSLAQPFNPTEGDWKEEHLFGDHPVRSYLEHYRNNWTGHSDEKKDRIGRLADKALQGYWYSNDVKGANVFHEIQRQLKNIGHKDANEIDWSGHHDELVQKIRERKKSKKTKMAKFRSPAGGMVVRGQFYPGGKMLPLEATQTNPPPDKKIAARKKKPDSLAKLREFFKTK